MRKKILKGVASGLTFSGVAFVTVKIMGFNWASLSVLMYLYVIGSVAVIVFQDLQSLGVLSNLVLVMEGEELKMKKVFSGEKYRLKGELEKL